MSYSTNNDPAILETDERIRKITQIIQRDDGSEAKIVAQQYVFGTIGVEVFRRESPADIWKTCSYSPHPDWRKMSVDEYIRHGRSEMLQTVSPGEILKLTNLIGKPMNYLDLLNEQIALPA